MSKSGEGLCLTALVKMDAVEQNGHRDLATGQRTRPRAVKQEEILTGLDCPRAEGARVRPCFRSQQASPFDPESLSTQKG